ncbi:MAG: hypothetical protein ABIZ92_06010 [Vicinamibacterales bacterium]
MIHPSRGSVDSSIASARTPRVIERAGVTVPVSAGDVSTRIASRRAESGATHGDHFDGFLTQFDRGLGWKETKREADWTPGGPDAVFMEWRGGDKKQPENDIVKLGVLTQREFDSLTATEQAVVQKTMLRLSASYDPDFFVTHRQRLRNELNIIYGI